MNAYVTVLALSEVGRIWEIRNSATSPCPPPPNPPPPRGGGIILKIHAFIPSPLVGEG